MCAHMGALALVAGDSHMTWRSGAHIVGSMAVIDMDLSFGVTEDEDFSIW